VLLVTGQRAAEPAKPVDSGVVEVHFFYHSGCSHCGDQEPFNEKLAQTYPSAYVVYHNGAAPGEYARLTEMIAGTGVTEEQLDFPLTIIEGRVFIGWESEETTGKKIEEALQQCLAGSCQEAGSD